MKVWLDALTPKQLLFTVSISKELERKGYQTIITTRNDPNITDVLKEIETDVEIIGEYGYTLEEKLRKDAQRILALMEKILEFSPDVLVSYPSPTAVRVAFGLSIPTIIYTDTPHAIHAHRLTIPLANHIIYSSLIDKEKMAKFLLSSFTITHRYNGVDELSWLKNFEPDKKILDKLGLEPKSYIVMRPGEKYASYYKWERDLFFKKIIEKISSMTNILLLPRYPKDKNLFKGKNIVIPERNPLATSLIYYSLATITGGGTIARESALLGVPGINLYPGKLEINNQLAKMGFPLYKPINIEETINLIKNILKDPDKYRVDTKEKIKQLEPPTKPLLKILG